MSSRDAARDAGKARRARPRLSLKMQAIGFLSRREHSRQELRAKLLASLRKRAREDAALAAAAEELTQAAAAQPSNGIDDAFAPRLPAAASASTSLRAQAPARAGARDAGVSRAGAQGHADDGVDACERDDPARRLRAGEGVRLIADFGDPATSAPRARSATGGLTLANGAPLPAALRSRIGAAVAAAAPSPSSKAATADEDAIDVDTDDDEAGLTALDVSRHAGARVDAASDLPDDELERIDPEAAVERLLDWLVANKYLSDTRFVESRVNARSGKQGALRIKLELSRHGLALEPEQAAALRETEFARAQALWQRKFGEVAADPRQRAKQARFLAARGFAAEVVRRIVGGRDED